MNMINVKQYLDELPIYEPGGFLANAVSGNLEHRWETDIDWTGMWIIFDNARPFVDPRLLRWVVYQVAIYDNKKAFQAKANLDVMDVLNPFFALLPNRHNAPYGTAVYIPNRKRFPDRQYGKLRSVAIARQKVLWNYPIRKSDRGRERLYSGIATVLEGFPARLAYFAMREFETGDLDALKGIVRTYYPTLQSIAEHTLDDFMDEVLIA